MAKDLLGKKDAQKALIIQERLTHDYKPFFTNILESYKADKDRDLKTEQYIINALTKTKRAMILVARVFLGKGLTASTQRELDQLNELLQDIEDARKFCISVIPAQKAMKRAVDQAHETIGITPEDLSMSVNLNRGAKKEYGRSFKQRGGGGFGGGLGGFAAQGLSAFGISPGLAVGWGLASQFLGPLLGPLYQALPLAYAAGTIGYKGIRGLFRGGKAIGRKVIGAFGRRAIGRQRVTPSIFNKPIMPTTAAFGAEPRQPKPVREPEQSQIGPTFTSRGYIGEPATNYRDPRTGRFATAAAAGLGAVIPHFRRRASLKEPGSRELHYAALPTFYFFNKLAFRAKWTKEVLHELKATNTTLKRTGRKTAAGGKLSILELIGAGAVFHTLAKAALILATKLLVFAGVIGLATVVFTKLYDLTQELKRAKQVEHRVKTEAAIRKRPMYGKMRSQIYRQISEMDTDDVRKATLRAEADKVLKKIQIREEFERIESMPTIWFGPDRSKKQEARKRFRERVGQSGFMGWFKSLDMLRHKEGFYKDKFVEMQQDILASPQTGHMYPRLPVTTEVKPETYERIQEALYPKGPEPAKDEAMGILKTLFERAKESDALMAKLLTRIAENEEEIAKEAKKQTAALERTGTGGGDGSGDYDSTGPGLNEMNYNGADSRMED